MKKFLPFSRRQPSLDRYTVNRTGWSGADRFSVKSMRRTSATSLSSRSIQVVRGAYNIDLNKVDSSFTKLHRACLLNDELQVRKHLHKIDNNSHDSSNRYPIHLATVNGNFSIVKLLIENNANPNVQDNEENTPMIKSIECGHERLVKFLLNNGADPNISDQNNNTALHWAIMTESIIAIDALLTSKKCDLSLRNNKDETCLHLAVRSPLINASTFEAMVKAGSDLEVKDQLGLTPLDIAQASNNKNAINSFNRFLNNTSMLELKQQTLTENDTNDNQVTARNACMCEEYKLRLTDKSRENLTYETKVIQLESQLEISKVDMAELKEKNQKLESKYKKLVEENSKLKSEISKLLEQINKSKLRQIESLAAENDSKDIEEMSSTKCLSNKSIECGTSHKQFLSLKAINKEKIDEETNKLKKEEQLCKLEVVK